MTYRSTFLFALLAAAALCLYPPAAAAQAGGAEEPLVFQAGDVLRVTIWRESDLSGEFQVSEVGTVTLPLLGVQPIAGRSLRQVDDTLRSLYARELRNPSITIVHLRRVNVLGEVLRPGLYPVDPTVSLTDIVALAGGTTPDGDLRRIRIVRGGAIILERVEPGLALSNVGVRSGDQIFVGRRSWMDRNSGTLVAALLSATISIVTSILISRSR